MSYQSINADGPAETTCSYGASLLHFRGPQRALNSSYVACLGGEETFGRFVEDPFPTILERRLDRRCLNLGSLFCGVEALTQDAGLLDIVNAADVCVLQMPGLLGQSNRFYRVHPRRNDRFVTPTPDLIALYPEEDFTDIHFVRHLLTRLKARSDARIELVEQELRTGWIERLSTFLDKVRPPVVMLRLEVEGAAATSMPYEPAAVDSQMIEALRPRCAEVTTLGVQVSGVSDELEDMLFGTLQQPMAEHMIGPATHRRIAEALAHAINDVGV
ncbi:hypothetical protein RA27_17065 [Ruegeria sp. ANG-R]|uniref:DUF6473 family protein n=1 Tax=Ruegeria sp. ANG-R TaxID=1577903 RepID=UPI00057F1289|nr:DUF6473 family protein [Ruegeria sp. ANG-R]KIC40023.1 hypothetical protein RA27_17065 [Ruegeria sp. ANG-R]